MMRPASCLRQRLSRQEDAFRAGSLVLSRLPEKERRKLQTTTPNTTFSNSDSSSSTIG